MNDHNLDDLIIDNIDPKNSKTKSFLTIIALAIVVLIVAIILTKIILKDPNGKALLEDNNTELISPELTLQNTIEGVSKKEVSTEVPTKGDITLKTTTKSNITKEDDVGVIVQENVIKPATVTITKEFSQELDIDVRKEQETQVATERKMREEENVLKEKMAKVKKEHEAKMVEKVKKQKELEAQRLAETKTKQKEAKEEIKEKGYFIQVGSFTQTPSNRFLSVIKNSGFNYKITSPTETGMKKLLIGPYGTKSGADTALVRVKDRINKSAFVVKK